jgi:hypothetical protein
MVSVSSSPSRTLAAALGYRSSESSGQVLQETSSGGDVDVLVGARDDRADPRPLTVGEMLQDVSVLVDLAAVNQSRGSKRLRHRFVQCLRAIEDDQQAAVRAEPAALEIGQQALTDGRILRRAIPEAERVFAARWSMPSATMMQ